MAGGDGRAGEGEAAGRRPRVRLHYYRPEISRPLAVCTENVLKACCVSYSGDVSPCVLTNISVKEDQPVGYFFQDREYPLEKWVYGNANDRSFNAIWKSKKARRFRAAFEGRLRPQGLAVPDPPGPCRRCYKLFELS